jgi:hypothetical protein
MEDYLRDYWRTAPRSAWESAWRFMRSHVLWDLAMLAAGFALKTFLVSPKGLLHEIFVDAAVVLLAVLAIWLWHLFVVWPARLRKDLAKPSFREHTEQLRRLHGLLVQAVGYIAESAPIFLRSAKDEKQQPYADLVARVLYDASCALLTAANRNESFDGDAELSILLDYSSLAKSTFLAGALFHPIDYKGSHGPRLIRVHCGELTEELKRLQSLKALRGFADAGLKVLADLSTTNPAPEQGT